MIENLLISFLETLKEYAEESEWQRTFDPAKAFERTKAILESPNADFLFIPKDGKIAGLAVVHANHHFLKEKYGTLEIFYVPKEFRGKGMGRVLMEIVNTWFEEQNVDVAFVNSAGKVGEDKVFENLIKKFGYRDFAKMFKREF